MKLVSVLRGVNTLSASVPSVDRAWELMELAYEDSRGIKVVGWADNSIMDIDGSVTFTAWASEPHSHEDVVLVLALRVPHPQAMSFAEVVGDRSVG